AVETQHELVTRREDTGQVHDGLEVALQVQAAVEARPACESDRAVDGIRRLAYEFGGAGRERRPEATRNRLHRSPGAIRCRRGCRRAAPYIYVAEPPDAEPTGRIEGQRELVPSVEGEPQLGIYHDDAPAVQCLVRERRGQGRT